jgi:I/LWEQ domain
MPGRIRDEPGHRDSRRRILRHSYEQLIFASDKVGGRRARAVRRGVACDVSSMSRANLIMSKTQERLEVAAKAVTEAACKAPLKLVRTKVEKEDVNYKNMAVLEFIQFKQREMEQQVEIFCTFGVGTWCYQTSAGGDASCRVSHRDGRDRLMSLDYTMRYDGSTSECEATRSIFGTGMLNR